MIRKSTAVWNGTGKEGNGILSSTSGVLNQTPYSFASRFMSGDDKVELLEKFALSWINLAIMQGHGRDITFKMIRR